MFKLHSPVLILEAHRPPPHQPYYNSGSETEISLLLGLPSCSKNPHGRREEEMLPASCSLGLRKVLLFDLVSHQRTQVVSRLLIWLMVPTQSSSFTMPRMGCSPVGSTNSRSYPSPLLWIARNFLSEDTTSLLV